MSNSNPKILEHYPVERLPADIRRLIPNSSRVTISLTEEEDTPAATDAAPKYLRFWGAAAHRNTSGEDAVARVRKLRDEWD